jgi:peptidoglycan/xylan/chitin deacetylase (PgdA/CDA1 family)
VGITGQGRPTYLLTLLAVALVWLQPVGSVAAAQTPGMVYIGPTDQPRIALTFDADMTVKMRDDVLNGIHANFDPRIIDELRTTDTPATIFLTGLFTELYPDVVRDLSADPLFELANHSYDHRAFTTPCYHLDAVTTRAQRKWEIRKATRTIKAITGVRPTYFRFPGGCHTRKNVRLVRSLGYIPVQWSLISGDAYQHDPQVIIDRVEAKVRNGVIVVMHLNGEPNAPSTYQALHVLIPELKARGFQMVTLSDLLSGA